MATLVAIAFLSHQLGSFLGVWLGGLSFDMTGSYDPVWTFAIAAGFVGRADPPADPRPAARQAVRGRGLSGPQNSASWSPRRNGRLNRVVSSAGRSPARPRRLHAASKRLPSISA